MFSRSSRLGLHLLGLTLGFLYLMCLPLTTSLMLNFEEQEFVIRAEPSFEPEFIVVLAAGYFSGVNPKEDVLNDYTSHRVSAAAYYFSRYPEAKCIMSGHNTVSSRPNDNQVRLMAEFAQAKGIPSQSIILEPVAINTHDHARAILELEGVDQDSRVVVVTSNWHIRRTKVVFDKLFNNIIYYPAIKKRNSFELTHLIPRAYALGENNLILLEFLARIWYFFRY